MDGPLAGGPAVTSWADGRLDVFGNDSSGHLMHRWYTGGAWSDWQSLGGSLSGAPLAAAWSTSRIDVFARGAHNTELHTYWDGHAWSAWIDEGAMP